MQDKLESKNTYMSYFKKEDIKVKEDLEEKTRTHVTHSFQISFSSVMTWLAVTLTKNTARNASTRASGANTEKKEKSSNRGSVPLSLRNCLSLTYHDSGQVYGWRENIDTFPLKNNRLAVCKRTFHNSGHL